MTEKPNTRRGLLSTAGAMAALVILPAAAASLPPSTPDAELIALCGEFEALALRFRGLHGDGPMAHLKIVDDDERWVAINSFSDAQDALLDRTFDLQATTLAGLKARARMFSAWCPEYEDGRLPHGCYPDMLLIPLLRDAGAMA